MQKKQIVSRSPFVIKKVNRNEFKYKRRKGKKKLFQLDSFRKYHNGVVTVDVLKMSECLGIPYVFDPYCPADAVFVTGAPHTKYKVEQDEGEESFVAYFTFTMRQIVDDYMKQLDEHSLLKT